VLTDAVFNLRDEVRGVTRTIFKLNRIYERFGPSRLFKYFFTRDWRQVRESVMRILEWDFDRVVMNHGQILESGGKEAMVCGFEIRPKVQVWLWARVGGARRVLLLKLRPERGGFWQPVTGSVDQGESFDAAAARELGEETGFISGGAKRLGCEFGFWNGKQPFWEVVYHAEAPNEFAAQLDTREHVDSRWVSVDEAMGLLKHESNREALRRLRSL
jgi:8-oxo-dGTP pyrophosphatase MutT (NUDIX family)